MNYNKIWSLINKNNLSQNKTARMLDMSATGFKQMMDRETMAVSTLERLAAYFDKPISYFFDEEDNESGEPRPPTYKFVEKGCRECLEKERTIEAQRETIDTQKMLIGELQGKKMANGA